MNERVLQFRIGMFVIVAGLVLTMLVVWFGESPALLRQHAYLTVWFSEAPGVAEGIPVRKSGIRIGEVVAIAFDDRAEQPDGVLVTLALERKYKLRAGSAPRITRSLIGDVAIDMQPGQGPGPLMTQNSPARPPDNLIVQGSVAPDPSKAIEAASEVIASVEGTLHSIDEAAKGVSTLAKKAEALDEFLVTWRDTGRDLGRLAGRVEKVVDANEADLKPAVANVRQIAEKLNATLDAEAQADLKTGLDRIATASARLDTILADAAPLAKDLGADASMNPKTNAGQLLARANRVAYDIGLLSRYLSDGKGGLNRNGSVQRLLTDSELYDNLNAMATSARDVFRRARPAVDSLNTFAGKVARDPGLITRGALDR